MAYTTLNTKNKRDQLKAQLDDFATFQWRGHHMFDDFGCFIINDKNGSLKFYNGPSFTNQYAKTQFSSSVNALLGVDFKQQTIPMKVGLYWFTIEEYQEFLECIGPYQVNYITFNFDDKYGYLVKSGKIADSIKHVIGIDDQGKKRYYTELDLTWEVLGDACARSNLAYEYEANNDAENGICTWKLNTAATDMIDQSILDTPLIFEIPCRTTSDNASLKLTCTPPNEQDDISLFEINLQNLSSSGSSINDFECDYMLEKSITEQLEKNDGMYYCYQGLYNSADVIRCKIVDWTQGDHIVQSDPDYPKDNLANPQDIAYNIEVKDENIILTFVDYFPVQTFGVISINNYARHTEPGVGTVNFDTGEIIILESAESDVSGLYVYVVKKVSSLPENVNAYNFPVTYNQSYYNKILLVDFVRQNEMVGEVGDTPSQTILFNTKTCNWVVVADESICWFNPIMVSCVRSQIDSNLHNYLTFVTLTEIPPFKEAWATSNPLYQLYLRYDSETGLIYIQNGSQNSWHLLNYQTDNAEGNSLLKSAQIYKYKLPGKFSTTKYLNTDFVFTLTYSGIDLSSVNFQQLNQAITIYSRKNII